MATFASRSSLLVALLAFAPVACGGSDADTTGTPSSDTGASGDGTTDGSDDGSTTDGTSGDGVTDGSGDGGGDGTSADSTPSDSPADGDAPRVCSDEKTRAACTKCCGDEHPDGMKEFDIALIGCACAAGVCRTVCAATACATPPKKGDDPCNACLASTLRKPAGDAGADGGTEGVCIGPVSSACSSSAKCKAYYACLNSCKP